MRVQAAVDNGLTPAYADRLLVAGFSPEQTKVMVQALVATANADMAMGGAEEASADVYRDQVEDLTFSGQEDFDDDGLDGMDRWLASLVDAYEGSEADVIPQFVPMDDVEKDELAETPCLKRRLRKKTNADVPDGVEHFVISEDEGSSDESKPKSGLSKNQRHKANVAARKAEKASKVAIVKSSAEPAKASDGIKTK